MNTHYLDDNCTTDKATADLHFRIKKWEAKKFGFSILPEHKILELGSGNGILLNHLTEIGFKDIEGIDWSPRHEEDFPDLTVTQGSISDMPFSDNVFDILVSTSIFDENLYKQDRRKMLADIHRILKPNGVYIAFEPIEPEYIKTELNSMGTKANTVLISDGVDNICIRKSN